MVNDTNTTTTTDIDNNGDYDKSICFGKKSIAGLLLCMFAQTCMSWYLCGFTIFVF